MNMKNTDWKRTPFVFNFVGLQDDCSDYSLPFSVGGATQQGINHQLDNQNNHDSLSIKIDSKCIIGVLCDGCSGTHDKLRNSISNNETGAKLVSFLLPKLISSLMNSIDIANSELFLSQLTYKLISKLSSSVNIICENDLEKEIFILDFLTTTILGFVVTEQNYIVFYYGDGILCLNNELMVSEDSGSYFSKNILRYCFPEKYFNLQISYFKCYKKGNSQYLDNIFLASDGFNYFTGERKSHILEFIEKTEPKNKNGFDYLLQSFRGYFLNVDKVKVTPNDWIKDDASFILLRRTS